MALVVDPAFGARLEDLARRMHVWVLRSADNERAARRLRRDDSPHSLESGLTLFGSPGDTAEDACVEIVGTVEEHHGEYSHDPPLDAIEVFGIQPTPPIREALAAYGFQLSDVRPDGFVASRGK